MLVVAYSENKDCYNIAHVLFGDYIQKKKATQNL